MPHTLLLADGSATIQRIVELTFAGQEVRVIAVSDGEQAIARVEADCPDIVLADIALATRSGYEVAAFVNGHPACSHVPVLLLAGAFDPIEEERIRRSGSAGVIVKPFAPRELIDRVKMLLGRAAARATSGAAAAAPDRTPAPQPQSLDDYFERLDAALAARAASPGVVPPAPAPEETTSLADAFSALLAREQELDRITHRLDDQSDSSS